MSVIGRRVKVVKIIQTSSIDPPDVTELGDVVEIIAQLPCSGKGLCRVKNGNATDIMYLEEIRYLNNKRVVL